MQSTFVLTTRGQLNRTKVLILFASSERFPLRAKLTASESKGERRKSRSEITRRTPDLGNMEQTTAEFLRKCGAEPLPGHQQSCQSPDGFDAE